MKYLIVSDIHGCLPALEKVLQRVIKPTDIEASIDEMAKVNELYLLLVQKIPLHFDGQINVTENNSVNLISNPGATLEVGKEILITFYREQDVSFCGISVHLYFVNILKPVSYTHLTLPTKLEV